MNDKLAAFILSILLFCLPAAGCTVNNHAISGETNIKMDGIGLEKAKEIALEHAQVSSSDDVYIVKSMETNMGRQDGKNIYEIDFIYDNAEYAYEIDMTGEIIHFSEDIEDFDLERYRELFPKK